jgi:DNA-binding transcriptional ArsR family regulator
MQRFVNCPKIQKLKFLDINNYLYNILLMSHAPDLNSSFAALADPTRRALLARLALGEATVMELAQPFEMSQPAISQHLKVLEDAGLIVRRVDGAKRPRRLAKAGLDAMEQWLGMLRTALEKNYDRLDGVLAEMQSEEKRKMP